MKKLLNLKAWLTIEDTARHLSILFDESVTEADVLRLGLDGHLPLSVNFVNHARGRIGHAVNVEEATICVTHRNLKKPSVEGTFPKEVKFGEVDTLPENVKRGLADGSLISFPMGDIIDAHNVIQYTDKITWLTGIWDLPMIGGERLDVEHRYQQLTGGPEVTLTCLDGAFVKSPSGEFANIQENYDNNEFQKGSRAHLEKTETAHCRK